jgi:hypothetical protein
MPRKLTPEPVEATSSESFDHQMKLYAVAAAAAGVSMLALAQSADAEVVITRKNIPITHQSGGAPIPVYLDLNHDGINDFALSLSTIGYRYTIADFRVTALDGGAVIGTPGYPRPYGSALVRGGKIGPSAHFSVDAGGSALVERSFAFDVYTSGGSRRLTHRLYGKWNGNVPNRYLGVKFLIDGETHYGWLRLTVNTPGVSATISAYAYETLPNQRILAGVEGQSSAAVQAEPKAESAGRPSLGMLALGATALAAWRQDEAVVH